MRSQDFEPLAARYEQNIGQAAEWLETRGLSLDDVAMYRLGVVDDRDTQAFSSPYLGRLVLPYLTGAGVVDLRFRTLGSEQPKYLSRPGAHQHVYNVGALHRDSDSIVICEGEIDAIVMDLYSGIPAVGIPGVQAFKPHFKRLFSDYDRILVIGDGDAAGREFTQRLVSQMEGAMAVTMPDGLDANDMLLTAGPEALTRAVA